MSRLSGACTSFSQSPTSQTLYNKYGVNAVSSVSCTLSCPATPVYTRPTASLILTSLLVGKSINPLLGAFESCFSQINAPRIKNNSDERLRLMYQTCIHNLTKLPIQPRASAIESISQSSLSARIIIISLSKASSHIDHLLRNIHSPHKPRLRFTSSLRIIDRLIVLDHAPTLGPQSFFSSRNPGPRSFWPPP